MLGIHFPSLELDDAMSSEDETQRILALGLTHEENLKEASKLKIPHLITVVSLQLTNARDEKIQNEIDLIESQKFADKVMVSGSRYIGSELVKTIKKGVLETDIDIQTIHFRGTKLDNGSVDHTLTVKIEHVSNNKRIYTSANLCDPWGRCDGDIKELKLVSSNSSNCSTYACNHVDVMEFNFSDEFLKSKINEEGFSDGLTMRINRKRFSNKVNVPSSYLTGYLKVAN
jgi:hypothetical protein